MRRPDAVGATVRVVLAVTNVDVIQQSARTSGYSPEFQLLLLCARVDPDDEAIAAVRTLLAKPIDWNIALNSAKEHRVVPLLYRALSTMDADLVPSDVLTALKNAVRATSWSNLKLTAELMRVMGVLADDEIAMLPYKGPTLAEYLYGDVALRQFGDLDIILHEKDVPRARELLGALGYRTSLDLTGKDVRLYHDRLDITLEVHWSITSDRHPIRVAPQRLWKNVQRATFAGKTVLFHTPEDLLWILCIHGGQHRWERLSWLCDVAEIVRTKPIDWDRAMHHAKELRAGRTLTLGLLLARDLLGVTLPPSVERLMDSDPVLGPLGDDVKSCLGAPRPDCENLGDLERYYIMLGDRLGDRLRIAVRQAVPYLAPSDRDTEMLRLPRYLSWVLYVVRPVRLAWSYGLSPIRRLIKGLFQS